MRWVVAIVARTLLCIMVLLQLSNYFFWSGWKSHLSQVSLIGVSVASYVERRIGGFFWHSKSAGSSWVSWLSLHHISVCASVHPIMTWAPMYISMSACLTSSLKPCLCYIICRKQLFDFTSVLPSGLQILESSIVENLFECVKWITRTSS